PSTPSSRAIASSDSASSAITAAPAPSAIRPASAGTSGQGSAAIPASASTRPTLAASRPVGASTSTRSRRRSTSGGLGMSRATLAEERRPGAQVDRRAREHTLELADGRADLEAPRRDPVLAERELVEAAAHLRDADALAHLPHGLEEAEEDDGVGQVAHVQVGLGELPDEAVLREGHERDHVEPPEAGEQLVEAVREEGLLRR